MALSLLNGKEHKLHAGFPSAMRLHNCASTAHSTPCQTVL